MYWMQWATLPPLPVKDCHRFCCSDGTGIICSLCWINRHYIHRYSIRPMYWRVCSSVAWFLTSFLHSIAAVGRAAMKMVEEVRRQFREIPVSWRKGKTWIRQVCSHFYQASIKEMMAPGLIAIIVPVVVGLSSVLKFWAVVWPVTVSGVLMGIFQNNAGGAWDNAKKSFEKVQRSTVKFTTKALLTTKPQWQEIQWVIHSKILQVHQWTSWSNWCRSYHWWLHPTSTSTTTQLCFRWDHIPSTVSPIRCRRATTLTKCHSMNWNKHIA